MMNKNVEISLFILPKANNKLISIKQYKIKLLQFLIFFVVLLLETQPKCAFNLHLICIKKC